MQIHAAYQDRVFSQRKTVETKTSSGFFRHLIGGDTLQLDHLFSHGLNSFCLKFFATEVGKFFFRCFFFMCFMAVLSMDRPVLYMCHPFWAPCPYQKFPTRSPWLDPTLDACDDWPCYLICLRRNASFHVPCPILTTIHVQSFPHASRTRRGPLQVRSSLPVAARRSFGRESLKVHGSRRCAV